MRFYIYIRERPRGLCARSATKYIVLPRADAGFMGRKLRRKLPRRTCRRRGRRSPPLTATRGLRGHASSIGCRASRRPFAESTRDRIPGCFRVFPDRLRKIAAADDEDRRVTARPLPLPLGKLFWSRVPPFPQGCVLGEGQRRGDVVLCVACVFFCIREDASEDRGSASSERVWLARDARFIALAS